MGIKSRYLLFLIVFLGALSAFGPFVTDFYLPVMPSMAGVFSTTTSMVQLGLAASMIGLAVGQVIFGPLSDKWGRRPVLLASMALFSVAAFVSLFSPTIEFFNICRFLQGLGGAGGIVLSRSIATDCWEGRELAKSLTIISAINGIAPVAAPIIGGLTGQFTGWRGIFIILLLIGLILFAMCIVFRESVPPENRIQGSWKNVAQSFFRLFRHRYFNVYLAIYGFGYSVLFGYLSSASFIVQNHFGFNELQFSLVFALNAFGSIIGSVLALRFKEMKNAAFFAMCGITIATGLQFVFYFLTDTFVVYEGFTFLTLLFLGFMFPSVTSLTMEEGKEAVGSASAVLGSVGYLSGGLISPLVGIGNIVFTSALVLFISSIGGVGFGFIAWRRKTRPADI
ncbi:MAG: multidrug effflux MFS transporter [Muribaculaceae bacterium]|nr:multidrug effflux MFS transporter [Muribaculaceae bacterium]